MLSTFVEYDLGLGFLLVVVQDTFCVRSHVGAGHEAEGERNQEDQCTLSEHGRWRSVEAANEMHFYTSQMGVGNVYASIEVKSTEYAFRNSIYVMFIFVTIS